MQVPSEPLHISHSPIFMPLRGGVMAEQLSEAQVASIVTVSPAQPVHVHVVDSALGVGDEDDFIATRHGGHSSVAAQQPLLPGLEPSAHGPAEAQAAAKTSTRNAVRLRAIDLVADRGSPRAAVLRALLARRGGRYSS